VEVVTQIVARAIRVVTRIAAVGTTVCIVIGTPQTVARAILAGAGALVIFWVGEELNAK